MSNRIKFISIVCILVGCCFNVHSQEKSVPLIEAFAFLEHNYKVKLNYTNKNIKKKVFLSGFKTLPEQLNHLERQTHLKFEQIPNTQNIIVRSFKATDIINICGYVRNKGFIEKDITISINHKNKEENTTVNHRGYFEINQIGFYDKLLFFRNGFFVKQLNAKELFKIGCPIADLSKKRFELSEVVLKNYLADGIRKKDQKITLKTKEFKVLAGLTEPDLIKTIQQIPNVSSPFETASQLFVRGGTPDQNLILWNGVKTYNQSHFFGLISAFNPYVIDSLDFYHKGIPSNFGGRLASVVELKSSRTIENNFSGNIGSNLIFSDAVLKIPLIKNRLSATVSARRSFSDLIETPTFDSFSERVFQNTKVIEAEEGANNFVFSDFSVGINTQFSTQSNLQINALYAENDLIFLSESQPMFFSDNLRTVNNGVSTRWEHNFTNNWVFEANAGIANYLLDYSFITQTKGDNAIRTSSTKKNFINDLTTKAQLSFAPNTNHKFNIGLAFEENNIRYEFRDFEPNFSILLDEQDDVLQTQSAFLGYQLKKRRKFSLEVGLRANKYSSDSKLFLEPRIFTRFYFNKRLSINATYSNTSQAVTQINESVASNLSLENLIWTTTNDDNLETLTNQQLSLGAIYERKNWFVEFDSFYKKTKNITTITSGFITELSSAFSLGEQRVLGADLFIKKKIGDYNTWLSLAYLNQETRFNNFNNNDFFRSNLDISYSVNWSHFYEYKNFNFGLTWLWHTGKPVTEVENIIASGSPVMLSFEEINTNRLGSFHRLDASILYSFKLKPKSKIKYKLGLSVQNIYNQSSTINREFRVSPGINNELLTLDFNSLGLTPNVSFRMLW